MQPPRRRVEPITKLIEEAEALGAGRVPGICPACGQPVNGDELIVSLDTNSISRWGQVIKLPPQATEIMHAIKMDHPNACRPTTIQRRIYGGGEWPEDADNVLNVYVSKIRRLIAPLGVTIQRYHSRGYRLSLHDEPVISINDR